MTTVPEPAGDATADEGLRIALLDGAPEDLNAAATTLLTDIPGAVYTDPAMAHYITRRVGGQPIAQVDWARLGTDMLAGALLHLPRSHRALLLIAASIGAAGAVPVRLGALLQELGGNDINLLIGALQHAVGVW